MVQYIKTIIALFLAVSTFTNTYAQAQCDDTGNLWNESWVSCQTSPNPNTGGNSHWILYEFHEPQVITTSHIWNANRNGESGWGAESVAIDYSTDGINWTELDGQFNIPIAPETNDYKGVDGPNFEGISVHKILITILSTYSNDGCASIAEVQFNVDPTACNGQLDVCGVCNGPGMLTWYYDADGDGLGDHSIAQVACEQPPNYVANDNDLCDDGSLGWSDVAPLFQINGCTDCHGSGAGTSSLNLTSYAEISNGGEKCGSNLLTGDLLVTIILPGDYNGCQVPISSMNEKASGDFDANELAILQEWIDQGALEYCTDDCENTGLACDDGDACTISDMYDANCNCIGVFEDADNDNICAAEDCDDNNPNIPTTPNTSCDDGNEQTINDIILANGCTCQGTYQAADYCATDSEFPWHEWIYNVKLNTIDNTSGKDGYGDFINISTTLDANQTYDISLTTEYSWATFDEFWKVWIDYNQDNIIQEETEIAFSGITQAPENGTEFATIKGSITIPDDAKSGATRMRITMKRNGIPAPCELLNFGEIEDYTVIINNPDNGFFIQRNDLPTSYKINADFKLYPNPTKRDLYIKSNTFADLPTTIIIYNHLGQIVKLVDIETFPREPFFIQLKNLPNGLYSISLKSKEKNSASKRLILVQH